MQSIAHEHVSIVFQICDSIGLAKQIAFHSEMVRLCSTDVPSTRSLLLMCVYLCFLPLMGCCAVVVP